MKTYCKDYPRPQFVREEWQNLNGQWSFAFDDGNAGEGAKWYENFPESGRQITVPFTYETKRSGIGDTAHHRNVWYQRSVEVTQEMDGKRMLLHFEGSDFHTLVWINGVYVGDHKGGYARFSFDITKQITAGENMITVKVEDSVSVHQPRGKQRWLEDNFGCWYVQTTGIWKTVWMETVPELSLHSMKVTPELASGSVEIGYELSGGSLEPYAGGADEADGALYVETIVSYEGRTVNVSRKQVFGKHAEDTISLVRPDLEPWGVFCWTPDNPCMYDMEVRLVQGDRVLDRALSYFGMREIRIDKGNILLNGSPLYQRLILDQGYWEESHLTPPDEEALIDDIDKIHALGYNGLRKHMKIEDERFLYWCDVKGMLVWSEMAACYAYSDVAVEEFTREWLEVVKQNYNHPCIITWTPFNESWGVPQIKTDRKQQNFTESIYHLTKSIDSMRPVIVNDGWEHTVSDIITLHDYEEKGEIFYDRYAGNKDLITAAALYHNRSKSAMADGYEYRGQPILISEYGGIAFSGGEEGAWGYGNTVSTEEEFLQRMDKITTAIKKIPYIVGYCYTQVSDVQQEINGLLKADHSYKMDPEKIREINCRQVEPYGV
ncbi:MAG: glycoside hydrolase family 2 TIM barrel-domain containing protein [Eubacteriales bacterium]|nr:glycoside hydrolase family 2 TIM barrel-domain containing protein [Eubacteriales bacterium]